jgi:formylglycine-generating enzyme required for sulfatase activity
VAESNVFNCDDGQTVTAPVGLYKPNPWGLYDILGNVQEWVEDCYVGGYQEARKDGSALATGDCAGRVVRGGFWNGFPRSARAASRSKRSPEIRSSTIGFRLARTVAP